MHLLLAFFVKHWVASLRHHKLLFTIDQRASKFCCLGGCPHWPEDEEVRAALSGYLFALRMAPSGFSHNPTWTTQNMFRSRGLAGFIRARAPSA
jgi:hypothetical protein